MQRFRHRHRNEHGTNNTLQAGTRHPSCPRISRKAGDQSFAHRRPRLARRLTARDCVLHRAHDGTTAVPTSATNGGARRTAPLDKGTPTSRRRGRFGTGRGNRWGHLENEIGSVGRRNDTHSRYPSAPPVGLLSMINTTQHTGEWYTREHAEKFLLFRARCVAPQSCRTNHPEKHENEKPS